MAGTKADAQAFAERWANRGDEKQDTQSFWHDLAENVLGMTSGDVAIHFSFEKRTSDGGFIDLWVPDARVLVEQKSLGTNLDKTELRRGKMVTPFEQALMYADDFPSNAAAPRYLVICDFGSFRVHDSAIHGRNVLASSYDEFTLEELGKNPSLLGFMKDPTAAKNQRELDVSMKAGDLIHDLYEVLGARYVTPEAPESVHALNVLCTRLVFCLYCEDADLFGTHDAFYDYMAAVPPAYARIALQRLFRALDTPLDERDPYDDALKPFPYINGGLFRGEIEIPNFDQEAYDLLLEKASACTNWAQISPTIFGGIFESTLNPETQHQGGMHYTSPENIHKLIDPLFLDGLKEELSEILDDTSMSVRKRRNALKRYRSKLAGLQFLEPCLGSGNFAVETYLCLRRLEDACLSQLNVGQTELGFEEEGASVGVSLAQFHGIEINDFACAVARTSMWIARLQANIESDMILDIGAEDFPLNDSAHIVCGNALDLDWNTVLPASQCDYVMGNPPFLGYNELDDFQKADRIRIFGPDAYKRLDYVACWYRKATDYMLEAQNLRAVPPRCGFVSTNSICQGEQVKPLWEPLMGSGVQIDFANDTFKWSNAAARQANVFCIIVGFSLRKTNAPKLLYHHEDPDSEATLIKVPHLNAYLRAAPDVFVPRSNKAMCALPNMSFGSMPRDNGNLIFQSEDERDAFVMAEPGAEKWIRAYMGSEEFLNGKKRYCLWMEGASPDDFKGQPLVMDRLRKTRDFRLSSNAASTRRAAETPWLFVQRPNQGTGSMIVLPRVSSGRRKYIPIDFVSSEIICSDQAFFIRDATMYQFGVLASQAHNAWNRVVCGRLKSDYRYSRDLVYNNLPWPGITRRRLDFPVDQLVDDVIRTRVEDCAQALLDARAAHTDSTLADMYDPANEWLYPDVVTAHTALDAAVEAAYGISCGGDEDAIVAYLFELFANVHV